VEVRHPRRRSVFVRAGADISARPRAREPAHKVRVGKAVEGDGAVCVVGGRDVVFVHGEEYVIESDGETNADED
jgi:hypothetical protein